jgi:hypothetical protein
MTLLTGPEEGFTGLFRPQIPDHSHVFRLTPVEQAELDRIMKEAGARHERDRKAAAARGRRDFPGFPFEHSWAFNEQFRNKIQNGKKYSWQ